MPRRARVKLAPSRIDAVLFDVDGVVTRTADLHAAAWKEVFDPFLRSRLQPGERFRPFDMQEYRLYVDGKPRYDGVESFLAARGIRLPRGEPADPPEAETVCGLGNRKDAFFQRLLESGRIRPFESTVALVRRLRRAGLKAGVFSASRNAASVLSAAGVRDLFDALVDGRDAEALALPGKPHPASLLELARRLGVAPARAAVVEDAVAGVAAARAGGFVLVVGVNRSAQPGRLLAAGADVEVADLREVAVGEDP